MAHPGQPGVLLDGFGDYQKAWSRLRLTVGNTTTTGQYTHGPRGPFFPTFILGSLVHPHYTLPKVQHTMNTTTNKNNALFAT